MSGISRSTYNYLANTNPSSKEIHDLDNEKDKCNIDDIKPKNIKMLNTESELQNYLNNKGYNGCKHCLEKYHTD